MTLAQDYTRFADAGGGPLRIGQFGVVLQDDHSGLPYHVRAEASDVPWWYAEGALVRADQSGTSVVVRELHSARECVEFGY